MILECPSCTAKFSVPDGALGATGKQVRCSKCGHMWLAKPPALAAVSTREEPKNEATVASVGAQPDMGLAVDTSAHAKEVSDRAGSEDLQASGKSLSRRKIPKMTSEDAVARESVADRKQAIRRPKSRMVKVIYALVYMILFLVIVGLWTLKERPEWVGFQSSQGFAFEEMRVERMPQLGGERFTSNPMYMLEGVVRNTSDVPRQRPIIRVTLKKNTGGVVYMQEHPSPNTVIPAGEAVAFSIEKLQQPSADAVYFVVEMGNALEFMLREVPVKTEVKSEKH